MIDYRSKLWLLFEAAGYSISDYRGDKLIWLDVVVDEVNLGGGSSSNESTHFSPFLTRDIARYTSSLFSQRSRQK